MQKLIPTSAIFGALLMVGLLACSTEMEAMPNVSPELTAVPKREERAEPEAKQQLQMQNPAPKVDVQPRDVSHLRMMHPDIQGAAFDYDIPTLEETLEAGWHGAEVSPTHVVIKGTPAARSVRCEWRGTAMTNAQRQDGVRFMMGVDEDTAIPERSVLKGIFDAYVESMEAQYTDSMRQNFYHLMDGGVLTEGRVLVCYVDFAVSQYLLGAGPDKVTVGYDGIAKTRSYELYRRAHAAGRYGEAALLSPEAYSANELTILANAETGFANNVENRESVVFLAPMGAHSNIAFEVWQAIAQWDIQVKDGKTYAVRYGTAPDDAEHSQTLANLKSRISTASRTDAHAGQRIANASGLNRYYRDIGAYDDITPNDGLDNPFTPGQPPPVLVCASGAAVGNASANRVLVRDCSALLDARDAFGAAGSLNWSKDLPIADWEGVSISRRTGRISALYLARRNLAGSIPAELGLLTGLEELILHTNQLSGPIQPELDNLANLRRPSLHTNVLSGELPSTFGELTSLEDLELYGNQLTGSIPSELGSMTSLTNLSLRNNALSGAIPAELGGLANLEDLSLQDNQLSGAIPPELGSLTNLTRLYLYENNLTGTLPSDLGKLTNLERLSLHSNQLSGPIPRTFGDLANLQSMVLANNQLNGAIPPDLGDLTNLTSLSLEINRLSGPMPPQLGMLASLGNLKLDDNQLTGAIPSELGDLSSLVVLSLTDNGLSGEIPSSLEQLENLRQLYLFENEFTGCIPAALNDIPINDLNRVDLPDCPPSDS